MDCDSTKPEILSLLKNGDWVEEYILVRSFLKVICVPGRAYCSKTKNLEKIRRVILFILIHSFIHEGSGKKEGEADPRVSAGLNYLGGEIDFWGCLNLADIMHTTC